MSVDTTDPGAPFTEIDVALEQVRLNVAVAGPPDGRAVMLLHGFPDSLHLWEHQIPVLARAGYRVVAPDLRGFGNSDRPDGVDAYRMPALVSDVTGLLDALDVERAAVVGHDWGAGLAWVTAMAAPERVERLAVLSVGHGLAAQDAGIPQRRLSWYMLWFLFEGVAEKVLPADDWAALRHWAMGGAQAADVDPYAARQIADLSRPGALTAGLNWYRANIDPATFYLPPAGRSPRRPVRCPVLGVWSDGDEFLGEEQMVLSQPYVEGPWRYERVEGADHWIPQRAPERVSALLLDFLAQTF